MDPYQLDEQAINVTMWVVIAVVAVVAYIAVRVIFGMARKAKTKAPEQESE